MAYKITDDTNYSNIANAIRNKLKVSTKYLPAQMAAAIENIKSGEPDWRELGYEEAPASVMDGFDYAKDIYDDWDPTITNRSTGSGNDFRGDIELRYFPEVDTSNIANANLMFEGSSIQSISANSGFLALQNGSSMLQSCKSLTDVDISMGEIYNNAYNLELTYDGESTNIIPLSWIDGYVYSSGDTITLTINGIYLARNTQWSINSQQIALTSYTLESGDILVINIYKSLANLSNICAMSTALKNVKIDCGNRVGSLAGAFKDFGSNGYALVMPTLLNAESVTSVANLFSGTHSFRPSSPVVMSFPNATESQEMFKMVGNYNESASRVKSVTWGPVDLSLPVSLNCNSIFYSCTLLDGNVTLYSPNSTNFEHAFESCVNVTSITVDLSSATNVEKMFLQCEKLLSENNSLKINYSLDLPNPPALTTCAFMFQECKKIKSIPYIRGLQGPNNMTRFASDCWDLETTSSGEFNGCTYEYMFYNCGKLLNVNYTFNPNNTEKNTSDVKMNNMFQKCAYLQSAPTIGMIGSNESGARAVTYLNLSNMYNGCTSLENFSVMTFGSSVGTNCNINTDGMFTDCISLTDQSLENILQTCINIFNVSGKTRTLRGMGLSSSSYPDYKFDPTDARSLDPDLLNAFFATGCRVS